MYSKSVFNSEQPFFIFIFFIKIQKWLQGIMAWTIEHDCCDMDTFW